MRGEAWPEIRIGDLGEVFTGRTPSSDHPAYFGDDFPFITPGDMHQGKYARVTERSLSIEGAALLKRIKIPANSICVSCIGWQMGEAIMTAQPSFTNQQINTIVPNGKVEPSFLYYSLRPRKQELLSLGAATGVRTPILNKSAFCDLKVKIPPLAVQRRIAGILSAYDDLIENNTRRIKILEEMAQMVYREWFVNLRFPGHEKERMARTNIAHLPDGWTASSVGFLAEDVRRSVNPAELDPETPYIGLEHMPRRSIALSEWGAAKQVQSTKLRFQRGDVLFGKIRPYFHKVGFAPIDGVCSSDAIVIVPKNEEWLPLVLCCVSSEDFVRQATQTSQGTKMPRANWSVLARYPVALAKEEVLRQFNDLLTPILEVIRTLIFCNRNLRQTRGLLLPQLISGEVSVEHPEAETANQIS